MKVTVIKLTEEAVEKRDYRDGFVIEIDGKGVASFFDGEPEDANLSRDFKDCWGIPDLLKRAHEAGKNGETFELEAKEVAEF